MPDRDDVVRADEEVRLAELDRAGRAIEMGRTQDGEERVAVALELRPLVGTRGVLDREVVERELPLHFRQDLGIGLVQADPDEAAGLLEDLADIGDRDLAQAEAAGVGDAVDDSLHAGPSPAAGAPTANRASQPAKVRRPPAVDITERVCDAAPRVGGT